MDAKLTLKLNKKVIDSAKRYAKRNNKSLSALVENYFSAIAGRESGGGIEVSPNVAELSGVVKLEGKVDIKKAYGRHIEDKYK